MLRADNGRHAEFAAHDGGVAGASAAIGNDGTSLLHDGFPIRIGLVGDENVAGIELMKELDAFDHAHWTGGNFLADTAAGSENRPAFFESKHLHDLKITT